MIQPKYDSLNWWYAILTYSLQGMAFVHCLGFAHRDLKSQNVLYDIQSGRAKVGYKLCGVCMTLSEQVADFGMTKQMGVAEQPRMRSTDERNLTTMMTSAFGTGVIRSTLPGLHCYAFLCRHCSGVHGTRALRCPRSP